MNLLTRRFPTILGILLLIICGVAGWYIYGQKIVVDTRYTPSKVKITNVADNKFTVSWVTDISTTGTVEYGSVGDKITEPATDDRDENDNQSQFFTHHVTVEGLQPNTQYAFRIISGGGNNRFDNNGSPYSVTTGPTIANTPAAKSLYGQITGTPQLVAGSIVYVALPGAAPASTIVTKSGNYSIPIAIMRSADLTKYIEYDPAATIANIEIESGSKSSKATVNTANIEPVPDIALGQDSDFTAQTPTVAQVEPITINPSATPTTASIFNVEPYADSPTADSSGSVILLNPSQEGETIATTKPEFRGAGPADTLLSITVHSNKSYADTVTIASDGTWAWSPPANLAEGEHTITIAYLDLQGVEKTLTRTFTVSKALATAGDPSFESTPSATTSTPTPTPTATPTATPTPTPSSSSNYEVALSPSPYVMASPSVREVIPSTESGVPVTGIITPSLLTGAAGLVIMVIGAMLLAI